MDPEGKRLKAAVEGQPLPTNLVGRIRQRIDRYETSKRIAIICIGVALPVILAVAVAFACGLR